MVSCSEPLESLTVVEQVEQVDFVNDTPATEECQ